MYLYFVLLSELEHFGLLSQYFQPLGSWSSLKDFHRKRIQLQLRSAGEIRKWKLFGICCIISRDIEECIPMPHLGSNTKSFYTIHRLYFSTRANVLDMIVRPLDSGTLTLHWVRVYKGDADRDTGNSSQDWVSWKYDEVWLREKKTTFWKHLKLPKEEGIKRLRNKIIHGRGQII